MNTRLRKRELDIFCTVQELPLRDNDMLQESSKRS